MHLKDKSLNTIRAVLLPAAFDLAANNAIEACDIMIDEYHDRLIVVMEGKHGNIAGFTITRNAIDDDSYLKNFMPSAREAVSLIKAE